MLEVRDRGFGPRVPWKSTEVIQELGCRSFDPELIIRSHRIGLVYLTSGLAASGLGVRLVF
jgi:hypothetical protein